MGAHALCIVLYVSVKIVLNLLFLWIMYRIILFCQCRPKKWFFFCWWCPISLSIGAHRGIFLSLSGFNFSYRPSTLEKLFLRLDIFKFPYRSITNGYFLSCHQGYSRSISVTFILFNYLKIMLKVFFLSLNVLSLYANIVPSKME